MARSMTNQVFQIQKETTPGTPVTDAMKRYLGLKATPGWDVKSDTYSASGYKVPTDVIVGAEAAKIAVDAIQDYNGLLPVAASVIGPPTTTTPGGATLARQHVMALVPDAPTVQTIYTGQWGDAIQMVQLAYLTFNSFKLTIERGQLSFDAVAIARTPAVGAVPAQAEQQTVTITGTPTGGTFTLTWNGQTTTDIDYDAAAADVQAALVALSNVGAGNALVTGGPGPDTPYVVSFVGALGGSDPAQMTATGSFTGGTTPAVAVTTTRAFGAGVTVVGSKAIAARSYKVYADDAWADLGTTQLLDCYHAECNFGSTYVPDTPINSDLLSYESLVEDTGIDYTGTMTVGFSATATDLIATYAAGALKFIRLVSTGPEIETGQNYALTMDYCIAITNPGDAFDTAPDSSVVVLPFDFTLAVDPVSGQVARLTLVNTVTGL